MSLFPPVSHTYGEITPKKISEISKDTEVLEKEVQVIQSEPFAGSDPGLVPSSNDDTQGKFLRGDGEWATPAGGSGGTSDYNDLANKPAIDGTTLDKNSTTEGLGLAKTTDIPDTSDFVKDEDLEDYAKKTDIPTVPTKVSDLTNDAGSDAGLVPASTNADQGKYLKGDGTWGTPEGGGGGDATLSEAVTSNLAVGAIASGTTLPQGTTFTEFAQKLLITEIAPTTTFSASGSGVKEVGTSVTPTLTLTITDKGTGTPTAIKFYDGSTLLDTQSYVSGTNTYTYTMEAVTTSKTVKGVLEYKKSNNTNATVEKSATYTFVMASYYGAVTTAPTDKAGITALTKNVKNTKAQTATFTLSNQRSCYCYPASFGDLTSIKDANNFEYLSSYTKTSVTVDDVVYNVYTLTDPVTASGFKQVYA